MEPPAKRKKIRKNGRKRKAEEENQIETTGWFDLPFELRIIIIEIMPDTTIYKFAQCSKLCYEEAISSKNYCDTMRIVERRDGGLNSYEIQFAKSWIMWLFQFRDDFRGGTIVKSLKNVMTLCDETNWQVKEDGQLFDVIAKYANEYILKFGRNLKKFELYLGCKAKSHLIRKIQLRNMKKIEKLSVSQTPRQVCMLKYKFVDFDQIKHVKSELKLPATVLSFDQLIQLKAERIHIYVMDLTPKDINQYIKYWRDGKLSANLKSVSIHGGFSEKNKKRKDVEVDLEGLELEKCLKPFREETYISNYNKTQKARLRLDDKMRFGIYIEDI